MGRPISAEMERALKMVKRGKKPYPAALEAGVTPSALYRQLARRRKAQGQK